MVTPSAANAERLRVYRRDHADRWSTGPARPYVSIWTGLSLGVCVEMDESMPAVRRDLRARFMPSALFEIRLPNGTEERASPERQRTQTEATAAFRLGH